MNQQKIDIINKTNRAGACLVAYVNKCGMTGKKFNTLQELKKFMADETEKQKEEYDGETSEDDEEDDYKDGEDD